MRQNIRSRWIFWIVLFGANCALRFWFAGQTAFGGDERAIYENAAQFFLTGKPSFSGARVVYSGARLPGMLQDLLAGGPLYLSGGYPGATLILIGLLNAIGMALVLSVYERIFPQWGRIRLALWIGFAPWTFMYSSFLNASFLLPFSAVVFWGVAAILEKRDRLLHQVAVGAGLFLAIQVNLAAVFLFVWVGALAVVWGYRVTRADLWSRFRGVSVGAFFGSLTLLPSLWVSVFGESKSEASRSALLSSIQFDWVHFQDLYKIFFRFLTFPTGETTRFIGGPRGFGGAIEQIRLSPQLFLSGTVALFASVFMIVIGTRFLFRRENYRNILRGKWTMREACVLSLPLMLGLFIFSLKEPSAHALLPFLPMSFFPVLWEFRRRPWPLYLVVGVTACNLHFSFVGYAKTYFPSQCTDETAVRCLVRDPSLKKCSDSERLALQKSDLNAVRLIFQTIQKSKQATNRAANQSSAMIPNP